MLNKHIKVQEQVQVQVQVREQGQEQEREQEQGQNDDYYYYCDVAGSGIVGAGAVAEEPLSYEQCVLTDKYPSKKGYYQVQWPTVP